jgi:hypothetical protein
MKKIRYKPKGIITDIPAVELGPEVWSGGVNIVMQDDAAKLAAGYRVMNGTRLYRPDFLLPNQQPSVYYWMYAGSEGIGVYSGQTDTDITPAIYTGAGVGVWTGANLNNLPILNNGVENPFYWDGNIANRMLPMPGWPAGTTAKWMRAFKYMAIAGDISGPGGDFENQVLWSESVDPGKVPQTWAAAPDNAAGDNVLAATPGAIVDGVSLRDSFFLLKNHSMYIMTLVGGQFIFNFRKFAVTSGVLSRNCAVEHKGLLYVFTDGDIIRTDGHTIQSIAERRVRKTIFSQMDSSFYYTSFMTIWAAEDELWFCYPEIGNTTPNKAAVYNIIADAWGFRDLPNISYASRGLINDQGGPQTWDTQTNTWDATTRIWNQPNTSAIADSIVMAEPTNKLMYALGELEPSNPIPINGTLSKLSMPLIEDHQKVLQVQEVWPLISAQPGVQFQVRCGGQMKENDPVDWCPSQTFTVGTDDKLDIDVTGRYFSLEFSGVGYGSRTARFLGFEAGFVEQGRF